MTRRGKFILIALDAGTLTVHLGMTGKLLVEGEASEHTHGVFTLDDGMLLYHDPRQFGRIEFSEGPPPRVARLGPEPLEIGFEEFRARLQAKTRMKALLLNQTFLAGLGNIYADESLFAAGIHPLGDRGPAEQRTRREAVSRDPRHSHACDPAGRIVDFRLCERARRARLVPDGAPRVRPRRPAVRELRPADPQDPGGAARDTLTAPHCQKR